MNPDFQTTAGIAPRIQVRANRGGALASTSNRSVSDSRPAATHALLLKSLVLMALVLCMSAPEELFFSQTEVELNPYVGIVKLALLGLGIAILLLCTNRKRHWAIASPFMLLIVWAVICWIASGAETLPARNLVSSFGGILVIAALCGAAERVGGIRGLVRLMVWAVLLTALTSVLLGLFGLQPMPGESRLAGELEWFHGVGLPWYAVAGCAVLIAWALAWHLVGGSIWLEPAVLALLAIPALTFLRAFLIGIVVSILYAGAVALWRSRRKPSPLPRGARPRCGRVVLLGMATIALGTVIFLMKTGIRAEGDELSGREIIWPIEIASVIQHPIFGLGPFGDVDLLRFKEDLPQLGAAHSDYLGSAVCYGLPGLLLFVAALCSLWRRILRFGPVNVEESACRYAALFSLAGLSTTMIAENVIRDPRLFTLYLLFPALCFSAAGSHRRRVANR